jgi:hypothetical protein
MGDLVDRPSATGPSGYQNLPPGTPSARGQPKHWLYLLWPSVVRHLSRPSDFMQWLPTGPTTAVIRDQLRCTMTAEMRAALPQLAYQPAVNAEDTVLITRVQARDGKLQSSMGPCPTRKCA